MKALCSISTFSHLAKTFTLAESCLQDELLIYVLCVDFKKDDIKVKWPDSENIRWIHLEDLNQSDVNHFSRKYGPNSDEFRWSLKPMLLKHLCLEHDQVCYLDNDMYFLQNPLEIFEKFQQYRILLSPHFYPNSPDIKGANWFEANFQVGVYNAGFIGVRKDASDFLDYWINACRYALRKSYFRGLFDDQKFLDVVPAFFQQVYIHPAPTWNFAGWNDWYPKVKLIDNQLHIDKEKVLFVHFTSYSLNQFSQKEHPAFGVYESYLKHLNAFSSQSIPKESSFSKRQLKNYLRYLYWRLLKRIQSN
ncbi:MAG: hypothetical protein ACKOXP_07220 [Flavobacteriales bacterium]